MEEDLRCLASFFHTAPSYIYVQTACLIRVFFNMCYLDVAPSKGPRIISTPSRRGVVQPRTHSSAPWAF